MKVRLISVLALVIVAGACKKPAEQQAAAAAPGPAPGTAEWKIQSAMSAGPSSISAVATIMDWPNSDTGHMTQLRAGNNGWTCLPDQPSTPSSDPACIDGQWGKWAESLMAHRAPNITGVGVAYMLQGEATASNTDPFKMQPDSGQSWLMDGPHLMILSPGAHAYDSLPAEHNNNSPYVMYKGTPYAHIMVPLGTMANHTM